MIKKTQVRQLALDRDRGGNTPPLAIDLETTTRTMAITTIIRAFLDDTVDDERWFLDQLAAKCQGRRDHEELGRALFMTWEQVQRWPTQAQACRSARTETSIISWPLLTKTPSGTSWPVRNRFWKPARS